MKPPGRQAGFDPHQIRTTVTTWRRPSSVTRPRGSALPPAGAITTSRSNRLIAPDPGFGATSFGQRPLRPVDDSAAVVRRSLCAGLLSRARSTSPARRARHGLLRELSCSSSRLRRPPPDDSAPGDARTAARLDVRRGTRRVSREPGSASPNASAPSTSELVDQR
jgi:hypothetical protein